ncbi:hypothetical protein [Oceanobacillus alkalisoli]|uniref:hypothetical protein n=1 Tax=Oceanobacillus alkalisoli TaxID=2925113 RepID=UPI001EE4AC54|nr:hypothetical protein [Oceanobacillus alkalisoli]MCG5104415.1 hypothetical protein [Oceanobacillus alkalisoli]
MNTMHAYRAPLLKQTRHRDYVFVLEDLELAFPKDQLESITIAWNNGMELENIAEKYKRAPEEIFLALFHQAMENKVTRAFAYRKKGMI